MKFSLKKITLSLLSTALLSSGVAGCTDELNSSSFAVDRLIGDTCAAVQRCDSRLRSSECVAALNGDRGREIWDDFGLAPEGAYTSDQVRRGIDHKTLRVDPADLEDCLYELRGVCEKPGTVIPIGNYSNVDAIIPKGGACPHVLSKN